MEARVLEHTVTVAIAVEATSVEEAKAEVHRIFARAVGPEIPWVSYDFVADEG